MDSTPTETGATELQNNGIPIWDEIGKLDLAKRIACGLVGWLHNLASRTIGNLADEDAARFETCQIIHSQRVPVLVTKQVVPLDWDQQNRHMDVGIGNMGCQDRAVHGAIELKWSAKTDSGSVRKDVIQDIVRLASVHPGQPIVRFLVMGGGLSLVNLFSAKHEKETLIDQRDLFCEILAQKLNQPSGYVTLATLNDAFPDAFDRLPPSGFRDYAGIRTKLLASAFVNRAWTNPTSEDHIVLEKWGEVRVWQIDPIKTENAADAESSSQSDDAIATAMTEFDFELDRFIKDLSS